MATGMNCEIVRTYVRRDECNFKFKIKCRTCKKEHVTDWDEDVPDRCPGGAKHEWDDKSLNIAARKAKEGTVTLWKYRTPTPEQYKDVLQAYLKESGPDIDRDYGVLMKFLTAVESYKIEQPDGGMADLAWTATATEEQKKSMLRNIRPNHAYEVAKAIINSGLTDEERKNSNGQSAS